MLSAQEVALDDLSCVFAGRSQPLVFLLMALLALLAAAMAFVVTYNEYSKHFKEKGRALRAALRIGAVAFP
jgi:hypothetical protein